MEEAGRLSGHEKRFGGMILHDSRNYFVVTCLVVVERPAREESFEKAAG